MVQVFSEPLCRRHHAPLISEAVVMRVGLFLASIALSLVIAFATGGFWPKIKPTLDQAQVHYTYDALLLFEGQYAGQEQMWSTSSLINSQFPNQYVPASVQASEEDINFDGKPDVIEFVASIQGDTPVYGVKALLQFHYKFHGTVRLRMYSFAYLAHSSPTPGGVLYTDGELMLQQRTPITDRKFNGLYDSPMLDSKAPSIVKAVQGATSLEFQTIIKSYLDRNYTTAYTNYHPVWKASSGNGFTLHMRVRIPTHQVVWYRPQVIEMLKFGWIQFLATYVVLWWLFYWFQFFIFRYRVLSTRIVSDAQPKMQRF